MTVAPQTTPHRGALLEAFLRKVAASRFLTISLLLHLVLIMLFGGAVLFHAIPETPDFTAGGEGFVVDTAEQEAPGADPTEMPAMDEAFVPPSPTISAPPITAIASITQQPTAFAIAPATNVVSTSVSDSMKQAVTSMSKGQPGAGPMGTTTKAGLGGLRTGSIFGRKVEAVKLGVILDVSGSAHPFLAGAITEIQKTFPDAILVLYPGCGLVGGEAKSLHKVRKLRDVSKKDREAEAPDHSTPGQLKKAMRVEEFEKLVSKESNRDTLFISWYEGNPPGKLIGFVDVAFDDLMGRGVDTIYWFADFRDKIVPSAAEDVIKKLKRKKIKVHLHNFSGGKLGPEAEAFAEKTGGSINLTALKGPKN